MSDVSRAGLKAFCMFFLRYPLILWITVLPPLSELIPPRRSRTTERSESVSEEAEERPIRKPPPRALADSLMQLARQVSRLESGQ